MAYILARKLGMTRVFTDDGQSLAVSVLEAGPCTVTQVKTVETDGYQAVQLGFGTEKHPTKAVAGHQAKATSTHKLLREFRVRNLSSVDGSPPSPKASEGHGEGASALPAVGDPASPDGSDGANTLPTVGEIITVANFQPGQAVRIVGASKGKGFAGTIKRHHFTRGPQTHGSDQHRQPGSIGSGFPQHVFRGMRMAGHLGAERVTVFGSRVQAVYPDRNLLVVTGPVPGPNNGLVTVETVPVSDRELER